MPNYKRREIITSTLCALGYAAAPTYSSSAFPSESKTEEPDLSSPSYSDAALAEKWFKPLMNTMAISSPFKLQKFLDNYYVLTSSIDWSPTPGKKEQSHLKSVVVPAGFVTDLASIPRVFWAYLSPADDYAYAAVVHDYLYWEQTTSKADADSILNYAMMDLEVKPFERGVIYTTVDLLGTRAWRQNAKLKAEGERRIIKKTPNSANVKWIDYKKNIDIYSDEP